MARAGSHPANRRDLVLLVLVIVASLLLSTGNASRVLSQDGPAGGMPDMLRGEAQEIVPPEGEAAAVEQTEEADIGGNDAGQVREETRKLPPFEYVTSCVPLNILILASRAEDQDGEAGVAEDQDGQAGLAEDQDGEAGPPMTNNGEAVKRGSMDDDEDAGPYSVWIEADADVISGLTTEVINSTLHVDFADADFSSTNPIKVIVNAPENALKGVHNSGVISTMVVLGFTPTGDFNITNTSPFGALVVDDLKADGDDATVNIASYGNGFTAVIGGLEKLSVKSTGGTGDIFIDGAANSLNVDLQGKGNILVDGSEHLLITGDVGTPSSGIIAYTRGGCSVATRFEDDDDDEYDNEDDYDVDDEEAFDVDGEGDEYDDEGDEYGDDEREDDAEGDDEDDDMVESERLVGGMMPGEDMGDDGGMDIPDMMVHGCVKLPEEAEPGMFGVPDVDDYMTWTCGLMVKGSFNCLRGVASQNVPPLDCGRRNTWRPECRGMRRGSRVQGRAAHGINPESQCAADVDPVELMMSSAVEGMEDVPRDEAADIVDDGPMNRPSSAESRAMQPGASVQSAYGVVEGVN